MEANMAVPVQRRNGAASWRMNLTRPRHSHHPGNHPLGGAFAGTQIETGAVGSGQPIQTLCCCSMEHDGMPFEVLGVGYSSKQPGLQMVKYLWVPVQGF